VRLEHLQPLAGTEANPNKVVTRKQGQLDLFDPVTPFTVSFNERKEVFDALLLQLIGDHLFVAGAGANRIPLRLKRPGGTDYAAYAFETATDCLAATHGSAL
jgi:hypothetical protein